MKRYTAARRALLFWCLFIGIGAMGGGICMLLAPDGSLLGMQALLPYFQVLPFSSLLFQDFLFPGIALICVNGITNLLAAAFLLRKKPLGHFLGGLFGITLMLWILIQFIIFPMNFMDISFFLFGLIQAVTGYLCHVFYRQSLDEGAVGLPGLSGQPSDTLVVYFSRLGRAAREARALAERRGAALFRLTTPERTEGTLGFWWCGRFGMHTWPMQLCQMPENLDHYKTVIIVSPIWVFSVAAPIRAFLQSAKGQIRCAEFVLVHFQPVSYARVFDQMAHILALSPVHRTSIGTALGKRRVWLDQ